MSKKKEVDISIIIVNYKTPELTIQCIKSIKENSSNLSMEIIVVDNFSQDNSLKKYKKRNQRSYICVQIDYNSGIFICKQ